MSNRTSGSRLSAGVIAVALMGLGACGGSATKSDEPSGTFKVEVTHADFPTRQHVAADTDFVLTVRNPGADPLPQLVVTIWTGKGGAAAAKGQGSFAAGTRPIWQPLSGFPKLLAAGETIEQLGTAESAGAEIAPTDSYTFGPLKPGEAKTMVWRVVPVRTGSYLVHYAVAAGTQGGATAVTAGGAPARGQFGVSINDAPGDGCVVAKTKPYTGRCV
jgi:hypothetical protein